MPKRHVIFEKISEDDNGAQYHVEAIHVTTTLNNRKYTKEELTLGARSLSYRPININHDESRWLPYTFANPAGEGSNCTLNMEFVPDKNGVIGDVWITDKTTRENVDSGKIKTVSIEQLPTKGEVCSCMVNDCTCEQNGIVFTGIALLETYRGVQPGDPKASIAKESTTTQYACTECKELFNSKEGLSVHRGMKHKPKEADNNGDIPEIPPTPAPAPAAGDVADQALTFSLSDLEQKMQDQMNLIATLQKDVDANPGNDALEDQLAGAKSNLTYLVMDYMHLKNGEKKEDSYPWEQCISDQMQQYGDMDTAQRVCGAIKAKYGSEKMGYKEAKAKFEQDSAEAIAHFIADGKSKAEAIKLYLQNPNGHKEKHEGCWQCKEHIREELFRAIARKLEKD